MYVTSNTTFPVTLIEQSVKIICAYVKVIQFEHNHMHYRFEVIEVLVCLVLNVWHIHGCLLHLGVVCISLSLSFV